MEIATQEDNETPAEMLQGNSSDEKNEGMAATMHLDINDTEDNITVNSADD